MHKKFDSSAIEKKWQEIWEEKGIYNVGERDTGKEKEYVLVEWPYPSGNLHIGHWYAFAVPDIYVRYQRMNGKQVLFPMGFDAFGLPAENAAIKRGLDPKGWTNDNIAYMKNQLKSMGNAFSWDKTTSSTDPEYYKWTQWMFTQFFENGIAYRGKGKVNWCPGCNTVIANEQVIAGKDGDECERCGHKIEKKEMPQWMLKITKYADRLVDDLDQIDWPEHIKEAQRQWIGRSKGAEIDFKLNLPTYSGQVLFASNNKGKLARMRKLVTETNLDITLVSPEEAGITDTEVVEDENDLALNAKKKALHFAKLTDLPVLADDTGFFVAGEELDPVTVKRNALAGIDEKTLTIEEVGEKMVAYYAEIAKKHGGEVEAEWKNALCLVMDGRVYMSEGVRPVILTDQAVGDYDPYLPVRALYKAKATGKHALTHNEEEELMELRPITDAIEKVFEPKVTVFTTRPDTLYGATYMVLAPEHALVEKNKDKVKNWSEVEAYIKATKQKDEQDRLDNTKEKTGVKLEGIMATNPASGEEIPVYIADYVLGGYGTGAIMAVPAHDERDRQFADKIVTSQSGKHPGLIYVIKPNSLAEFKRDFFSKTVHRIEDGQTLEEAIDRDNKKWYQEYLEYSTDINWKGQWRGYSGVGKIINSSDEFNEMDSEEAKLAITEKVGGRMTSTYRLRDWSIGRQRYWGVPIPIVYDPTGKAHVIPKEHLPWTLPEDVDFTPTGEPPLAKSEALKKRTEEIFGKGWTPEVETMDTFVDSSWYFLRYLDNKNDDALSSLERQKEWMPIDLYFGGAEHTTMHLLYSRFWQKALCDLELVTEKEPYKRRVNRGLILGPDGNKMSKSKGNVIDPDEQVARVGADTVKMYLAFMGPYEGANYPFDLGGIAGIRRFLERVYGLDEHIKDNEDEKTTKLLHKTIKKVREDIENYKFNTAISAMMVFVNHTEKAGLTKDSYLTFLKLMAPFAPHVVDELWRPEGKGDSVHTDSYPIADEKLVVDKEVTLGVQINGKLRGQVTISPTASEEEVKKAVEASEGLQKHLAGREMVKFIYVPGRIVNVVVK
ncbi:MAG: leucine--tRNA ligase [Candidatus Nomurabacteria bacterium]|nr:leucine--tRNA ligase [Candidatus Nomurabacteria bacterium]USN87948.1 MAG: leucine--tRNA ligase [Candidatus Nomurabacteria bacterium]